MNDKTCALYAWSKFDVVESKPLLEGLSNVDLYKLQKFPSKEFIFAQFLSG